MRRRTAIALTLGLIAGAGIALSRQWLSHRALRGVLNNPAPTEQAMLDYLNTSGNPARALRRLWETEKIPQRVFALSYLLRRAAGDPELWKDVRPWVLEATTVADSELQDNALQLLFDLKDEQRIPTALAYLASTDPDTRIEGLMRLNNQQNEKWAANFARMLDDPDSRVRTTPK